MSDSPAEAWVTLNAVAEEALMVPPGGERQNIARLQGWAWPVWQELAGPQAAWWGSWPCSCYFRPNRWQSQPSLCQEPAQEPLPSKTLQTQQSQYLKFSLLWTSCCLSGFSPFSEPYRVLCSMSEIWNRGKQPQTMAKAMISSQWHYLKLRWSPQAFVHFNLRRNLPVLFYFHFHICSRGMKK